MVEDVRDNGVDAPAPAIVHWPPSYPGRHRPGHNVRHSNQGGGHRSVPAAPGAGGLVRNRADPPSRPCRRCRTHARSLSRTTFTLIMLALSGGMALALGFIGIYGVIAYAVTQRRREIAIRLALGERTVEVRRRFIRHGLILTGAGLAIGVAASIGVTRLMTSPLLEVNPLDPLTYIAVDSCSR